MDIEKIISANDSFDSFCNSQKNCGTCPLSKQVPLVDMDISRCKNKYITEFCRK